MADIAGMLDELQHKTAHNPEWKARFLASREEADPISAFCRICREFGYEIYEMDLICAGENFYASMRRSTNGGGENSPKLLGEDDFYELFSPDWRMINESCISRNYRGLPCDRYCEGHGESGKEL